MKKVVYFYREEWKLFRERHLKVFLLLSGLFIFGVIASLFYFRVHPEAAQNQIKQLAVMVDRKNFHSQFQILFSILSQNLIQSIISLFLGLIPFFLLPVLPMLRNCFVLAALISYSVDKASFFDLIAGILPHGIIEFPVIIFTTCLGVHLSLRRLRSKNVMMNIDTVKKETDVNLPLSRLLRTFVLIVIPLIALSALIETFVTPVLLFAVTK